MFGLCLNLTRRLGCWSKVREVSLLVGRVWNLSRSSILFCCGLMQWICAACMTQVYAIASKHVCTHAVSLLIDGFFYEQMFFATTVVAVKFDPNHRPTERFFGFPWRVWLTNLATFA